MSTYDHIIVGRGIAGIVLSESLKARGKRVLILDRPQANSASKAAAGSMNPIAMKRIILSWRASKMMQHAITFYRELERLYGVSLLHHIAAERIHASSEETALWQQRELESPVGEHITHGAINEQVQAPFGSGRIPKCYWLNVQLLMETHAKHWQKHIRPIAFEAGTYQSDSVIHCSGAFDILPGLIPVQGELLTLHIPTLDLGHSIHRSGFLIPLGGNLYRLGATFKWDTVWSGPSEQGKKQLLEKLAKMIDLPFEVVGHWAGTRPTTKDRRPILGKHPKHSGHFVLNGLGSKGAMIAPWCADHLCDFMLEEQPLDTTVDITRFQ